MRFLEGVTVLEFCEVAAGPFCGLLLADLGAEVVKIERPGGDGLRQWPPLTNGYSENFASLNRNKLSVELDLKDPDDCQVARDLAASSDVIVENYRPGVLARYGLDYGALSQVNPKIVYCSISAFGQSGPRSSQGGFDLTMQAFSGIMSVTGEDGARPVKCGVPLSDFVAGLYGAYTVLAALRQADEKGAGTHLDVSMLGASLGVAALQTSEYFGTGKDPRRLGSAHPRNAPYQAFRAADTYFVMAAGNDRLWRSVCKALEMEELAQDRRFATTGDRANNQNALCEILEEKFATRPASHWIALFSERGVPCGPINTYSKVLDDDQVAHMDWIRSIVLPGGKDTKTFGFPVRFNGQAPSVYRDPPALGSDTEEVRKRAADLRKGGAKR